jgi:hypothetical protein
VSTLKQLQLRRRRTRSTINTFTWNLLTLFKLEKCNEKVITLKYITQMRLCRLYRKFEDVRDESLEHHLSRQRYARWTPVGGSRRMSALRGRRSFLSTDPPNCLFAIKGIIYPLFSFHAWLLLCSSSNTQSSLLSFISTFATIASTNKKNPLFSLSKLSYALLFSKFLYKNTIDLG